MLIKMQIGFLKDILYITQIVKAGTITAVAQKNGVKVSNLCKLIKEAEKEFGGLLFIRTNKGLVPTPKALEIAKKADEIEGLINECAKEFLKKSTINCVKVYISKGLEFHDLEKVHINMVLCSEPSDADVIISTQEPSDTKNTLVVHTKIGNAVTQDLWLIAKDTNEAKELLMSFVLMFRC